MGFEEAEFQVTGTGFNSVSTAASSFEFADLTVTNNKVSIKIHETDDQATIAYNSAALSRLQLQQERNSFQTIQIDK